VKTPTVQVGELALNKSGTFKIGPFGSSLKKTELVNSGIPVAGIENVLPNKFLKGFRRFITRQKFEQLSDYEILPNDVLVTTMGTIGLAATAPSDIGRAIFDSHLFRMRVDTNRVFPPYLCYGLNSDSVASQLARMARGAIMDGLNTTIFFGSVQFRCQRSPNSSGLRRDLRRRTGCARPGGTRSNSQTTFSTPSSASSSALDSKLDHSVCLASWSRSPEVAHQLANILSFIRVESHG
jgi:hypothetical protein